VIDVRWTWAFLDTPRADAVRSWQYWSEVTGWALSAARGETDQFATLLPAEGDPWIKLQAVAQGAGGIHLDLDVDDARAAAEEATRLGAVEIGTLGEPETVVILRSPTGLEFCLTTWQGDCEQVREGAPDLIDQVCIDLPVSAHDRETTFWEQLTGWRWRPTDVPEFSFLVRPDGIPLRLLFQRLGELDGPARAHLDLACVDRAVTQARHVASGAEVVAERDFWTVLRDPVGRVYCLTDRTPTQAWVVT
jgi:Glyoxalase-like domain